ncbi:secreted RxLR effector protein 161-like [Ischnura elegans]|uniref:secreted RxLR effector protein 161-like n=1 Tax=Ischnura elegans TaxID=197161 RepID=UPI001ED8B685|nr:secreted RxLR effector protein 161-like [Ischnura elegans]
MSQYEMQDLGEAEYCLGMRIRRDRPKGLLMLDQTKYIEDLLMKYKMSESNPVGTPIEPNSKLKPLSKGESSPDVPYQQLIGALLYLSLSTRPDIAHTVNRLSQFNTCFSLEHWNVLKRLLRYLKGTKDLCLVYGNAKQPLTGYVDADWGACEMDRHSYTGYVFTHGGTAVSWASVKQRSVALSSTESEYIGLTEASKEALYLNSVLSEIFDCQNCPVLFSDNQSAKNLAIHDVYHSRTKHIDIRFHFIQYKD